MAQSWNWLRIAATVDSPKLQAEMLRDLGFPPGHLKCWAHGGIGGPNLLEVVASYPGQVLRLRWREADGPGRPQLVPPEEAARYYE